MPTKTKTIFSIILILAYAFKDIFRIINYNPSPTQISILIFTMYIVLTYVKDDEIIDNKVIIRVNKAKYQMMYSAIYMQLLFMISNFGIPQPIIEGIILCLLIMIGLYAYFK